jgi:hypothetical protein
VRHARAVAVVLALLAGCGRHEPPPPIPSAAQQDQAAIAAATAVERRYQDALARGELDWLADCAADAPETVRLVDMADDDAQGYSLAVTADAHGAVAIWQGIQRLGPDKYQAYGPKGMRLDVNGWRQLRQQLVDPEFEALVRSDFGASPPAGKYVGIQTFLASCLRGERRVVERTTNGQGRLAFERAAVTMRKLAGNYYSPPR